MNTTLQQQSTITATTLQQIQQIHRNTDGWITFFQIKDEENVRQYHYKLNEITPEMINKEEWLGYDSFISMNSFYTPKRAIDNLRSLHMCYVDIDCYKKGYSVGQVIDELQRDYFNIKLPTPNMINYSGRGIQLLWCIEKISGLAIERWTELQQNLYATLEHFGADKKSLDAARVFRLAGSFSSKTGEIITCDILHQHVYSFYDIVKEYYPNMKALKYFEFLNKHQEKERKNKTNKKKTSMSLTYLFTPFSLAKARLDDLFTLVKLREGNCNGYREMMLFLCRYFALQVYSDKDKAIQKIKELNGLFDMPISEKELLNSTISAEKYMEKGGILLKNQTIIDWLDITAAEQTAMYTLVQKQEKNRRKRIQNEKLRRKLGMKTKDQYNRSRLRKMVAKLKKFYLLKATYPKWSLQQYAEKLGCSKTTIHRYLKLVNGSLHELYALVIAELSKMGRTVADTGNVVHDCVVGLSVVYEEIDISIPSIDDYVKDFFKDCLFEKITR